MAARMEIRTHMMRLILGSQSTNRADILKEAGFEFDVLPPNIDEKAIRSSDAKELPTLLARAKTDALLPKISSETLLITSDQVVSFKGQIREKPETEAEARNFLETGHEFADENSLLAPYIAGIEGEMDSIRGLPMNLTRALIEEVTK